MKCFLYHILEGIQMSNQIVAQLLARRSIREFTGEEVKPEDLEIIFKAAQRAPTSINGQQISLVYTRDKNKLAEIAKICGGQAHIAQADVFIAIIIDFNRTDIAVHEKDAKQIIEQSAEGIMVGAVDAGIMLNALQMAAESFGYGTTAIGAVRKFPEKITALLDLPPKTFVAVGTTIGVPSVASKEAALKPRVPYDSFVMPEKYDSEKVKNGVLQYETDFKAFLKKNGQEGTPSYCEKVSLYYTHIYYPNTAKVMGAQGFKFTDKAL